MRSDERTVEEQIENFKWSGTQPTGNYSKFSKLVNDYTSHGGIILTDLYMKNKFITRAPQDWSQTSRQLKEKLLANRDDPSQISWETIHTSYNEAYQHGKQTNEQPKQKIAAALAAASPAVM